MNSFHIRIEDCTEAQKARLEQVYGSDIFNSECVEFYETARRYTDFPHAEQIHPDEMFKRLGLYQSTMCTAALETIDALGETVKESEQKIKDLEQQLAKEHDFSKKLEQQLQVVERRNWDLKEQLAKQPLPVDWSLIEPEYKFIAQNDDGYIGFYEFKNGVLDGFRILATRPKPKYTDEQITALKEFSTWFGGDDLTVDAFLEEQGNE